MVTTVEQAAATLAELETKHANAMARRTEIRTERRQLGFAAHTGDAAARAALDRLNADAAIHASEIASLVAAVDEAKARLATAQRDAALAAEREMLLTVAPITARLRKRAARLDKLAAEMKVEGAALLDDFHALHALGFLRPTTALVQDGARRAAITGFMDSVFKIEHLPPEHRRTFASLAAVWTSGIDAETTARLGSAPARIAA